MTGLREYVARAIQTDQEAGGAGILGEDEYAALHDASMALWRERVAAGDNDGAKEGRDLLIMLAADLGPHPLHIHYNDGTKTKLDAYYLRCADLTIAAYDRWLDERKKP